MATFVEESGILLFQDISTFFCQIPLLLLNPHMMSRSLTFLSKKSRALSVLVWISCINSQHGPEGRIACLMVKCYILDLLVHEVVTFVWSFCAYVLFVDVEIPELHWSHTYVHYASKLEILNSHFRKNTLLKTEGHFIPWNSKGSFARLHSTSFRICNILHFCVSAMLARFAHSP